MMSHTVAAVIVASPSSMTIRKNFSIGSDYCRACVAPGLGFVDALVIKQIVGL
jgi:hypothetical protein